MRLTPLKKRRLEAGVLQIAFAQNAHASGNISGNHAYGGGTARPLPILVGTGMDQQWFSVPQCCGVNLPNPAL